MKGVFTILLLGSLAVAMGTKLREGITPQTFPAIKLAPKVLPGISWEELRDVVLTNGKVRAGHIQADVTQYALKVVENIDKLMIEGGLDPLKLSDEEIKLIPTGTVDLKNGWLEELSTLNISGAVIAKYSISTKVLELTLPLTFKTLLGIYDYHTQILLLGITGSLGAEISNVALDLHMGFNFSSDYAFVDKADVKNSGKISIKFTGLGLLDWIIDLLDGVVVTLFHGLILSIVDLIIEDPVESVVDAINKFIDEILHRNGTEQFRF